MGESTENAYYRCHKFQERFISFQKTKYDKIHVQPFRVFQCEWVCDPYCKSACRKSISWWWWCLNYIMVVISKCKYMQEPFSLNCIKVHILLGRAIQSFTKALPVILYLEKCFYFYRCKIEKYLHSCQDRCFGSIGYNTLNEL